MGFSRVLYRIYIIIASKGFMGDIGIELIDDDWLMIYDYTRQNMTGTISSHE